MLLRRSWPASQIHSSKIGSNFLSGDGFWQLVPVPGEAQMYLRGSVSRAPSVAELRGRVAYARLDEELWTLLRDPLSRHQVREALIVRYFPEKREQLAALVATAATSPPLRFCARSRRHSATRRSGG